MTSSSSSVAVIWLATYLLHSSLLLGGLWITLRLVRVESHVLREWLWKLAAVAGLVTTSMQVSLQSVIPTWRVALVTTATAAQEASARTQFPTDSADIESRVGPVQQLPSSSSSITPWSQSARGNRATTDSIRRGPDGAERVEGGRSSGVAAAIHSGTRPTMASENLPTFSLHPTVLVVVVVLGVMGTLRVAWQMLLLTVWKMRWTADTSPTRDLLDRLTCRFAIRRRVELLSCDRHHEPFATGVLHWRVVLPRGIAAHLQPDEMEALLAHELAHLTRRDPIWSWIGCALCSCLAIQPLNLLACRRWNRESEFQCDQWSVKRGIDPLSLARCLTQVAGWRGPQPLPAAVLAASGEPGHLSQRVERLVDGRRTVDPWSGPFALGGFLAVACLGVAVFGFYAPGFAGQTSIRDEPSFVEGGRSLDDPQRRAERPQRDDPSSDVLLSELTALQSELQLAQDELQSIRRLATNSRGSAELEQVTARMRIRLGGFRERQSELRRLSQLVTEQRRNPQ